MKNMELLSLNKDLEDDALLFDRAQAGMISPINSRNCSKMHNRSIANTSIKKPNHLNESHMTIQNKKPLVIPQKAIQLAKPDVSKLDLSATQTQASQADPLQVQLN